MKDEQQELPIALSNDEIINFCQNLEKSDWAKMAKKTQTVKDIFAHLVGWQRECVLELRKTWNSGKQPWFVLTSEYDDFNLKIRNEFDVFQPDNLLQEFKKWDRALEQMIIEIGEDKLRSKREAACKHFGRIEGQRPSYISHGNFADL